MIIRTLSLRGFRSFERETTLDFQTEKPHGFFLLGGENRVEPDLGANGTGKSTIWDALCWVLFGKTTRGLKASNVSSWNQPDEKTLVRLAFTFRDESYVLIRTRNPNNLLIQHSRGPSPDAQPITQEELEDLIGCDYPTFLQTVIMGQFGRFFFDMSPTEKLDFFSRVLKLDIWNNAAQRAKERAKKMARAIERLVATESEVKGTVKTVRQNIEMLEKDRDEWGEKQQAKIETRDQELAGAEDDLAEAEMALEEAKGDAEGWEEDRLAKKAARDEIDQRLRELEKSVAVSRSRCKEWRADLEELEELEQDKICPTCGQEIEVEVLRDRRTSEVSRNLNAEALRLDELVSQVNEERSNLEEANARLGAEAKGAKENARQRVQLEREFSRIEERWRNTKRELKFLERELNPFLDLLEKSRTELGRAEEALANASQSLEESRKGFEAHTFWAKGFKDLRLWIIESALTELEASINNSLIELGLANWTVHLDIERETKSGGVSRGFHVMIRSPQDSQGVPWEAWSGGEGQRLRLAGNMGVSDLVCARSGFRPSIEVWDEPTAHLGQEGIDDLLLHLKHRARARNRQIWLVDHRSLDSGAFNQRFCVVKDDSGSRIVS